MSATLDRLPNGIALAIEPMPHARSAAIGLYASVGSRSEPAGLSGLAHMVEHMVFKGAGARDARAIAESIEDVGGMLNAWTSRDQTVFHARTLPDDVPLALSLIADLVRDPHLAEDELAREKQVILSELGEARDTPDDLIHDHLFSAAFGSDPLARPILGDEAGIEAVTAADCASWLADQYAPTRLTIAAAGAVDPDAIRKLAEPMFGDMAERPAPAIAPAIWQGGMLADPKRSEQAHLAFAFPAPPAADPASAALALFNQAVGGGMSSRLFQELREERGLAYSIYSWVQAFAECGIAGVNLSTDRRRASEAMTLAQDIFARAAETLSEAELLRARAQVEAGLVMAMEGVAGRCDALARSVEVHGRLVPMDELLERLRAVDVAAARAAGVRLLDGEQASATIGARLAAAA